MEVTLRSKRHCCWLQNVNERYGLMATVILSSMKPTRNLLIGFLLACFTCSAQISPSDQVFSKVVPALLHRTSVPLRLPTHIPGLEKGEFHAIINSADETGYIVVLGATPDCEGQHVCSYGALIGTAHPLKDLDFYGVSERKTLFGAAPPWNQRRLL
jgi:hypothetical protein